jgi:hypothetical protein
MMSVRFVKTDDQWEAKAGRMMDTTIATIKMSGPGCAFISYIGSNFLLSTIEIVSLGARLIADRMKDEDFTLEYRPVEGLHDIRKALNTTDEEAFLLFMRGVRAGMKL